MKKNDQIRAKRKAQRQQRANRNQTAAPVQRVRRVVESRFRVQRAEAANAATINAFEAMVAGDEAARRLAAAAPPHLPQDPQLPSAPTDQVPAFQFVAPTLAPADEDA